MTPEKLQGIIDARNAGRRFVTATNLDTGEVRLIFTDEITHPPDPLFDIAVAAQRSDRATTVNTADGDVFINVFNPPLRLIVIGAVHISQYLATMAEAAGYRVTVVDPRRAWATAERFAGIEIMHQWPDKALETLRPDSRTAIVTLTHDAKFDDRALAAALRSQCFYIGSLGSRRTHKARLERLTALGFGAAELHRINGPVGLDIGASSPAEIALAILAQITAVLRRGTVTAGGSRIAAIVLAAGQSLRMGATNKLLVEIDGAPMVGRVADSLMRSRADPVIVVTGHDDASVRAALTAYDVTFAHNPNHASGLASSLRTGLAKVPADCAGAIIALGDMPYVLPRHLNRLIEAFSPAAGRAICVPVTNGRRGNPVLLAAQFFADMGKLSGDVGARHLISQNETMVCEVAFDDDAVVHDIDDPSTLKAALSRP